jgi:diguanylate cyclase (GGDEF)-like protein/PAS domain S-box-containing protein
MARLSAFAIALGAAASVAFLLLPRGGLAQAWLFVGVSAAAGVAVVLGFRRNLPRYRLARLMMLIAWAVTTVANILWYVRPLETGVALPFPSLVDVLYYLYYAALVVLLYALADRRADGSDRAGILDAAIVVVGVGALSWVFLVDPYLSTPGLTPLARGVAVGYPVLDLVLLGAIVRLAMIGDRRSAAFWLLAVGAMSQLLADTWYSTSVLGRYFSYGRPEFVLWLLSYAALASAALHPSSRGLPLRVRRPVSVSTRRVIAMGSAALMVPFLLAFEPVIDRMSFDTVDRRVLAAVSAILFILVLVRLRAMMVSIGDLRRAQEALAASERRYRITVETTKEWIWSMNLEGTITYSNPAAASLLGYPPEGLLGTNVFDLIHEDDRRLMSKQLANLVSENLGWSGFVLRWRHADGGYRSFESNAVPVLEETGRLTGFRATDRDVTERVALELQLEHRAFHDQLTGLPNRALFADRLDQAKARWRRSGASLCVLMIDQDDFKDVNDTMGHAAGDAVLAEAARRMSERVRPSDTLARIGGDEFVVLLEASAAEAWAVAERLLYALRIPFEVGSRQVFVGATIGLAQGSDGKEAFGNLLRNADAAMYLAKAGMKGGIRAYRPEEDGRWFERLGLMSELRRALEREELCVRYQPILELETGSPRGLEALVRWTHPERGEISPAAFLPAAEQAGLVGAVDEYVLRRATRYVAELPPVDPTGRRLHVSVNLSAQDLRSNAIVDVVGAALADAGLDPDRLTLEITEGALVDDTDVILRRFEELKGLGVRLSIDDFGVGYSSLSYLRRLPVDEVKIDRSFVIDIASGSMDWSLARGIVKVLHDLGFETVAEGIEEAAQLAHIRALGCRWGQGYLFARPMTPVELAVYLADAAGGGGGTPTFADRQSGRP